MNISKIVHTAATVIAMSLLFICGLLIASLSIEAGFSFTVLIGVLLTVVPMVCLIVNSNMHSKSLSSIIILVLLIAELVFSLIIWKNDSRLIIWKNDSRRMGGGSVFPYVIHPIIGLAANTVCIIVKKVKNADMICSDYLTFESWIDIIVALAAAAIGCLTFYLFDHFIYCWIIMLALLVFRMVYLIKNTWSSI